MMFLDSLGNLSTRKEMEDSASGSDKRDMTRAPAVRSAFRTLALKLAKANIPLIITNHTYDKDREFVSNERDFWWWWNQVCSFCDCNSWKTKS